MITEQELDLALTLRDKIKEVKTDIAKIEGIVVSSSDNLSGPFSADGLRIKCDEYTKGTLIRFKEEILECYRLKLKELEERYKEIIESPSDALRRIIEENEQ